MISKGLFHKYSRILLDPTALSKALPKEPGFNHLAMSCIHTYQPAKKGNLFYFSPGSGGFVFGVGGGETKKKVPVPTKNVIHWSENSYIIEVPTYGAFCFPEHLPVGSFQLLIIGNNFTMIITWSLYNHLINSLLSRLSITTLSK